MFFKQTTCEACKSKDDIINFLKDQIRQKDEDWACERAEYKRTVDRLLQKERIAPIGQGQGATVPSHQSMELKSIFDEVEQVANGKDEERF